MKEARKTPPRNTTAAPGTPPAIYTPSRTPTGRPAAWARRLWEPSGTEPSARRPRPAPSRRLTRTRALFRSPAATGGLAGSLSEPAGCNWRRLRAPHESQLQGANPPGDSTQESRGGCGASQGPSPSGLAPAPPAQACQGVRGLPLPTASPTARRPRKKVEGTDPQTPSRLGGPWLPSGARTPPSSSLSLLPPPP